MGQTIKREACSNCLSKDNLVTFIGDSGDEITKCKTPGCAPSIIKHNESFNSIETDDLLEDHLQFEDLPLRGLSKTICEKLEYYTGIYNRREVRAIKLYNIHNIFVGYKVKWVETKKYSWNTKNKWVQPANIMLLGLDKCTDYSQAVVITEGEEDMLSVWEAGMQACSLTSGCDNVLQDLQRCLPHLQKYKEIILCLDSDGDDGDKKTKGKKALDLAKKFLKSKVKLKICELNYKDANEAWLQDKNHLVLQLFNAEEMFPEGIKFANDINLTLLQKEKPPGLPFLFEKTNKVIKDFNFGTLTVLCAGASIGKSSLLRLQVKKIIENMVDIGVATYFIEENDDVAPKSLLSIEAKIPVGELAFNPSRLSKQEWTNLYNKYLNTDRLTFVSDNFVPTIDNIIDSMEYLANIKNFKVFIIDHLTAIISGSSVSKHGERRDIDEFMEKLFNFARRTRSIVIVACHLTKIKDGLNWDEGRVPGMYDLRGSGSLATKPDLIIAAARNLKNPEVCDKMELHVLKNRWFSKTGFTEIVAYYEETGLIEPLFRESEDIQCGIKQ